MWLMSHYTAGRHRERHHDFRGPWLGGPKIAAAFCVQYSTVPAARLSRRTGGVPRVPAQFLYRRRLWMHRIGCGKVNAVGTGRSSTWQEQGGRPPRLLVQIQPPRQVLNLQVGICRHRMAFEKRYGYGEFPGTCRMTAFSMPSSDLRMLVTVSIGQRRGHRIISETPEPRRGRRP